MQDMKKKDEKLEKLSEPKLLKEEFLGGRLYTGPMYKKYNVVLRGLQHAFMRTEMIALCCSKEVADRFETGAVSFEEAKDAALWRQRRLARAPWSSGHQRMTIDQLIKWRPSARASRSGVQRVNS